MSQTPQDYSQPCTSWKQTMCLLKQAGGKMFSLLFILPGPEDDDVR